MPNTQKANKTVDDYLSEVSYSWLNSREYIPSEFALSFMNFIKLVNDGKGEESKTPPMHLRMLDTIANRQKDHLVNLVFRGSGKTSMFGEYFFLYLAVFNELPGLKDVGLGMYIADSMENGAKSLRKNLEYRYYGSPFLMEVLPRAKFTDTELEFQNANGKVFNLRLYGSTTGLRGTKRFGKRPQVCHVKGTPVLTDKGYHYVEDYYKKGQSRFLKGIDVWVEGMVHRETVTPEHRYLIGSRIRTRTKYYLDNGKTNSTTSYDWINPRWVEAKDISICKKLGNQRTQDDYICKKVDMTIEPIQPIVFKKPCILKRNKKGQVVSRGTLDVYEVYPRMLEKEWWWLYGLYLADGHSSTKRIGFTIANTQRHTVGAKLEKIATKLGYIVGSPIPKRGCYQVSINDAALDRFVRDNHLANSVKNIPNWVLRIDPEYQKQLLLGYIAGDGYIDVDRSQVRINSVNQDVIYKLGIICERLGLPYHIRHTRKKEFETVFPDGRVCISHKQVELRLSYGVNKILGIRIPELESQDVFFKDGYLWRKIKRTKPADEVEEFIPIETPDHTYLTLFGTNHNCVLDDLISDEAAKSKVVMSLIKDTIYNGVEHALDPKKRLIIFNGTPFNREDPLIEAVESGAWEVNVYPVCERFPCEPSEFRGAWEDRFDYNYINNQYQLLKTTGHVNSFYQELMLQISSDDTRMVRDEDIRWYSVKSLMKNKSNFNFYITTDFATSSKDSADWSVISVWAVNSNGDFFWVDGVCSKQAMDKNIDDLFSLVQKYRPIMEVGVEVTGQQGAFISWLNREMMERNIWFTFATSDTKSRTPGIRPVADKLTRFNIVLPWFKAGKMYFPEELRDGVAMTELQQELRLLTYEGIKGHDDFIDTISQLAYLKIIKPSEDTEFTNQISEDDNKVWMFNYNSDRDNKSTLDSYLV